jgi:nucleolin
MNRRDNRDRPRKHSDSEDDESRSRSRSEDRSHRKRSRRDSDSSDRAHKRHSRNERRRSNSRSRSRDRSDKSPQKDECSELFVRNLPWKADEQVVSEYFSKFGKVENVKILYDRQTGKAKGIGFVNFETRADAENTIANGEDLEIDGRKVEVNYSNQRKERPSFGDRDDRRGGDRRDDRREREPNAESKCIFVGNLSFKTDEDSIRDFFDGCGSIDDVRVASQDGKSKGFCHVEFESIEAASKAMRKNGSELDGRDIRVDFSSQRREGGNRDRGSGGYDRRGGRDGGFRGGRGGGRGGSRGGYDRRGGDRRDRY